MREGISWSRKGVSVRLDLDFGVVSSRGRVNGKDLFLSLFLFSFLCSSRGSIVRG